jgi:sulfatase modifying factor 1
MAGTFRPSAVLAWPFAVAFVLLARCGGQVSENGAKSASTGSGISSTVSSGKTINGSGGSSESGSEVSSGAGATGSTSAGAGSSVVSDGSDAGDGADSTLGSSGSTGLLCEGGCLCAQTPESCPSGCYLRYIPVNDGSVDFACENGLPNTQAPASCRTDGPGLTDCGENKEGCCTSPLVAGGAYYRTYTNNGTGPTGDDDQAYVSSFRLDKYDVTVGRFRQFVTAWNGGNGWLPGPGSGKHSHLNSGQGLANSASSGTYETGWVVSDDSNIAPTNTNLACSSSPSYSTWTDTASTQENLPINCVNWWESYAFCIWDGGFLPSEAEWEFAAAGGSQQLEYPWGTTAPGTACPGTGCQYVIYNCLYPNGSGTCTGVSNIAPVGTAALGGGLFGQLDLAGNVFQWNLDWYATYVDPCTDCAYLAPASITRITRGGVFGNDPPTLLPPDRDTTTAPAYRVNYVGFRCARAP